MTQHSQNGEGVEVKCAASPDHADIMETIENASDNWQKDGYTSALAEVRDMANVGRSLMEALPKGYCYMDSPAEIVTDLQNELDELRQSLTAREPATADVGREAREIAVHKAHCYQGEYEGGCKYGDDDCPAALSRAAPSSGHAMAEGERIIAAIVARKAIYEQKRDAADAMAEDDGNKHDRMEHTVEAFDYLLSDIAAFATTPPTTNEAMAAGMPDREDIARVLFDQRQTGHDFDDAADSDPESDAGTLYSIVHDDADAILRLSAAPSAPATEAGEEA